MISIKSFQSIRKGDYLIFKNGNVRESINDVRLNTITFNKIRGNGITAYTYWDIYKDIVGVLRKKSTTR